MSVYWSMLFCAPVIYLFYFYGNRETVELKNYNLRQGIVKKVPLIYAILIFGYFIFWIGMRTYFADTGAYIHKFENTNSNFSEGLENIDWDSKSPGFDLFTLFFKSFISDDFQWWLMTIAIVSGLCIMKQLRQSSVDFFFSSYLFIAFLIFGWMMNGMRQFICVAVMFACTKFIEKGEFFKYAVMIFLMSYVHFATIIMLPIYFVLRGTTWKMKTFLLIAGALVVSVFAEPFFGGVEDVFLADTAYEGSTNQFSQDDGVNPLRVLFFAITPVLAFIRRKELEKYYEIYPVLPICINASLITTSIYFVGLFSSGLLVGRIPIFYELYNLILIPFIIFLEEDEKNKRILKWGYIILSFAYFYLQWNGQYYISEFTGYIY